MQHRPRYRFLRRVLFPYEGDQPLSMKQSVRVMLGWMLFFPFTMAILALVVSIVELYSWQKIVLYVVASFFIGVFVFGFFGMLIIFLGNKAARLHQAWKIPDEQ